jgi:hypothetical protein
MKVTFLQQLTYWITWAFQGNPGLYQLVMEMVMRMFPAPPGPPTCVLVSQGANGMLTYQVAPPPDTAPDVASYEYTAVVAGVSPDQVLTQKKGDPGPTFTVPTTGVAVSVTVIEIDASGNRSEASDPLQFTSADTLPPPKPGMPTVTEIADQ